MDYKGYATQELKESKEPNYPHDFFHTSNFKESIYFI